MLIFVLSMACSVSVHAVESHHCSNFLGYPKHRVWVNRSIRQSFRSLYKNFIESKKTEYHKAYTPKLGAPYSLDGKLFHAVAVLGGGAEGTVYLMEAKDGARIAYKSFRSQASLEQNVYTLLEHQRRGVPTIRLIDQGYKYTVSEYIPGLTLLTIMESNLSELEKIELRNLFYDFTHHNPLLHFSNWLMYLEGDSIFVKMIDPF